MTNHVDLTKVRVGDEIKVEGEGWCTIISLTDDAPDALNPLHSHYVRYRNPHGEHNWWTYETDGSRPRSNNSYRISDVRYKTESIQSLGAKYDGGKLLFRALTRGLALPLRAVAAVLTYGALKYKEDSWQHVPNGKARYESALDRHLNAWKAGEKCDEESGLPHLAHAACNALFLLWFEITDGSIEGDYTKFNAPPQE